MPIKYQKKIINKLIINKMEKLKLTLDRYDMQVVSNVVASQLNGLGMRNLTGEQIMLHAYLSNLVSRLLQKSIVAVPEYSIKLDTGEAYALFHCLYIGLQDYGMSGLTSKDVVFEPKEHHNTGGYQNAMNKIIMVLHQYLSPIMARNRKTHHTKAITQEVKRISPGEVVIDDFEIDNEILERAKKEDFC